MSTDRCAVLVVVDGLRGDLVDETFTPTLYRLATNARWYPSHRSVFPSATRVNSASLATGCFPASHGLHGNVIALDEGDGLVPVPVGPPEFRERLRRATGRTLRRPTLSERLREHGGAANWLNSSAGAAHMQDPDGHGLLLHRSGSHRPGFEPVEGPEHLEVTYDAAGRPGDHPSILRRARRAARIRLAYAVALRARPLPACHGARLRRPPRAGAGGGRERRGNCRDGQADARPRRGGAARGVLRPRPRDDRPGHPRRAADDRGRAQGRCRVERRRLRIERHGRARLSVGRRTVAARTTSSIGWSASRGAVRYSRAPRSPMWGNARMGVSPSRSRWPGAMLRTGSASRESPMSRAAGSRASTRPGAASTADSAATRRTRSSSSTTAPARRGASRRKRVRWTSRPRFSTFSESNTTEPMAGRCRFVDRLRSSPRRAAASAQPGRRAMKSISTRASRASAVTPMQVLAGRRSGGKYDRYTSFIRS